nr:hypothetical protein [Aneurinibacillus sp. XH2]
MEDHNNPIHWGEGIIASSSERSKKYEYWEIETMISAKKDGVAEKIIAERLGRTYWSVVYKLAELKKAPNGAFSKTNNPVLKVAFYAN